MLVAFAWVNDLHQDVLFEWLEIRGSVLPGTERYRHMVNLFYFLNWGEHITCMLGMSSITGTNGWIGLKRVALIGNFTLVEEYAKLVEVVLIS